MPVRYYTSEDAGAPVLSGQAGALIALLDAVLVNGYGSQPPLGWSKPYTAANKAVYRLDATINSGRYLRVDDSNALYAIVNAYDAMSGVDSGTGGFPNVATPRYWRKSDTSGSASRQWTVFGDEAFAHLFLRWRDTYSYHHHVFGDLIPEHDMPGQSPYFPLIRRTTRYIPLTTAA